MIVRDATPADTPALVALFTRSVRTLGRARYSDAQLAAWAPDDSDIDGWGARYAALIMRIAEIEGEIAGFVGYEPNGHIDLLFASPDYAGRGVARTLVEHAETDLAGRGTTTLTVEVSLVAAPVFARCGFTFVEEQEVERNGERLRRFAMTKTGIEG